GLSTICARIGAIVVIDTTAVSATPFDAVAITRYLPVAFPAVYLPEASTVPPVPVQVRAGRTVEPSLSVAVALKLCELPGSTLEDSGLSVTRTIFPRPRPLLLAWLKDNAAASVTAWNCTV